MAGRTLEESLSWMADGTQIFLAAIDRLSDEDLADPTELDGWTGRHLVAHVAANAEALLNLVHWARTGEETLMYSSPQQRNADIEAAAAEPAVALRQWVRSSAQRLTDELGGLADEHWIRQVRTAQGRIVPASEVPWMRTREVMVHAVDLGAGVTFADLPKAFLAALIDDIVGKRSAGGDGPALTVTSAQGERTWSVAGQGRPTEVTGSLADITTYLAGRRPAHVSAGGGAVPELPRWL
jgi:maleylpyruvate isomerase